MCICIWKETRPSWYPLGKGEGWGGPEPLIKLPSVGEV